MTKKATSQKLTAKQENFCLKFVELGNASAAYREAYDCENMSADAIRVEANRLLQNPKITLRLGELYAEHRERHDVTVDSITQELEQARLMAIKGKDPSVMVKASMSKGELHGLVKKKHEHSGPNGGPIETKGRLVFMPVGPDHGGD